MFSVKQKEQNGRQNIDFKFYVTNEIKLDLPEEVIDYIYISLNVKTIGQFVDNLFPHMEKVMQKFPYVNDKYLSDHNMGMFVLEVMDDLTKKKK